MNKQFYFKQFNLACHFFALILNVEQFYLTHRYDPIRLQSLRARVDLGAMAMKGYSAFPKALPALLEPHHQIV